MASKRDRPEWVPENGGREFATKIVPGVLREENESGQKEKLVESPKVQKPRKLLNVDQYVEGILNKDRTVLARTITLVESNSLKHQELAQEVIKRLLPYSGNSIRIGITGVPGAGKSTFIESFGMYLIKKNHKLAVIAVDPSSTISRGSILGDKTRMEFLSREPDCFIRPSPSGGTLGGVTRKTREMILVCEAAGYDIILVETVGVGQNEVTVRSMVDFFLLLMIAGAGDELQGIKKGVIELADAIVVNKADGDNIKKAESARSEYDMALHYQAPATPGWKTNAFTCSALTGNRIDQVWRIVQKFRVIAGQSGFFQQRRQNQILDWITAMITGHLEGQFFNDRGIKEALPGIQKKVLEEKMTATSAVKELLNIYKIR